MQRAAPGARRANVLPRFEDVVAAEANGLIRYATALCGDPEQARDIVQEVLARAFVRWERIGATDRPVAYLMRMVTNQFLSWRRRWATRSIVLVDDAELTRTADPARHHDDVLSDRDELERRLARLPRRQQAALVLRYYEGLDYSEVAAVLGCAVGTARSACSRGLAALRLDPTSAVLTALEAR
jgi:RNA polymerase sigma-70 factor (sigma-E family)